MVNFHSQKHSVNSTLREFNDWLTEKAEERDLMKNTAIESKTEDTISPVTKTKVASEAFAVNTQEKSHHRLQQSSSTSIPSCIVCKGSHRLWECRVFKENTPMQRAKVVAEAKLFFYCLRDKHMIRQYPGPHKGWKDGCNSCQDTLLHGAERVFSS